MAILGHFDYIKPHKKDSECLFMKNNFEDAYGALRTTYKRKIRQNEAELDPLASKNPVGLGRERQRNQVL